ncbi:anthrone oxygenase family protein [Leptospira sp. GIMC2001]|uniref:anthrone oxygenase family protein n=1 Tax=Leptospira sp. GIMC2001 TaxID=1513297 RepID=UPI00234AE819|nr:anthrone oxygenase family protein [Leptospira sp. GIMC2001]WCL49921.1 DUF1772 domain-containing protein [Leptospira sp. GIMC2001]
MKNTLPYIAIIGTSAFFGNLLVIGLGFGMYWQMLDPMEFMRQFGIQFPLLLAPTMGILLPAILATVAMVIITKGQQTVRKNWTIALICLMITCTITTVYHLPTNIGFINMEYSEEVAASKLNLWLVLHWVRSVFVAVAAVYSVKAFKISLSQKD